MSWLDRTKPQQPQEHPHQWDLDEIQDESTMLPAPSATKHTTQVLNLLPPEPHTKTANKSTNDAIEIIMQLEANPNVKKLVVSDSEVHYSWMKVTNHTRHAHRLIVTTQSVVHVYFPQ